jgi:hypothetical protein
MFKTNMFAILILDIQTMYMFSHVTMFSTFEILVQIKMCLLKQQNMWTITTTKTNSTTHVNNDNNHI